MVLGFVSDSQANNGTEFVSNRIFHFVRKHKKSRDFCNFAGKYGMDYYLSFIFMLCNVFSMIESNEN